MKNVLLLILAIVSIASCAGHEFIYNLSGSAILKDKAVVHYDMEIKFETQKGVEELKEKLDKVNHAIRIILVQRRADQMDKTTRLWSVVNKVLKSQINEPIAKITVKTMNIEEMN